MADLRETITACLRGDEEAWRTLFDLHAPAMFHVLRGLGASPEIAEDIVGDVLVQLVENRRECLSRASFSDERQFRRWLIVLAKHRLWDRARRPDVLRVVALEDLGESLPTLSADEDDPSERILEGLDVRTACERLMSLMSDRERFIVKLYFIKGLKQREIAELTRRPLGVVSSIIFRAKRKMRRVMQENETENRSMGGGCMPEEYA